MKIFNVFVILFLSLLSIWLHAGELAGSRSLYVLETKNTLKVYPRGCRCDQEYTFQDKLCNCWMDFDAKDYPFMQGMAENVLYLLSFSNKYGKFKDKNNQTFLLIPTPKALKRIFTKNPDAHFIFLKEDRIASEFLNFIAQGKMPIANVSENKFELAYQAFFSDLFSQVILWFFLPIGIKKYIQKETRALLNLSSSIELKLKNEPSKKLAEFIKSMLAHNLKTSMKTLANRLLITKTTNLSEQEKKQAHKTELVQINRELACILNFGYCLDLELSENAKHYKSFEEAALSLYKTTFYQVKHILTTNMDDDPIIKKIPLFDELSLLPFDQVENALAELLNTLDAYTDSLGKNEDNFLTTVISTKNFLYHFKHLVDKWKADGVISDSPKKTPMKSKIKDAVLYGLGF